MNNPDIWTEMKNAIQSGFQSSGYQQREATLAADLATDALYKEFAGQKIGYLPKKRFSDRDKLMQDYRKGVPIKKLANKYSVCRATVYGEIRKRMTNIR